MALIALSGKKQSGKDLTGKIINILLNSPQLNNKGVLNFLEKDIITDKSYYYNKWEIKKFADKLKDIVCLLIGCNREQLENEEFKSTPLSEEWWYYTRSFYGDVAQDLIPYIKDFYHKDLDKMSLIKMTPRLMLQLLGTQCCREIIHPQIWVNALFADYTAEYLPNMKYWRQGDGWALIPNRVIVEVPKEHLVAVYPNWIITDMRFPNEQEAVDIRDGICIRVNRKKSPEQLKFELEEGKPKEHKSETALDNALFDYTIDNNGTIEDLINKVREILIRENLIKCKVVKDK